LPPRSIATAAPKDNAEQFMKSLESPARPRTKWCFTEQQRALAVFFWDLLEPSRRALFMDGIEANHAVRDWGDMPPDVQDLVTHELLRAMWRAIRGKKGGARMFAGLLVISPG